MRLEAFDAQIERLRRCYSPSALNEERVKLMWEAFKNLPDESFDRAVSSLIAEYTTQALPSLSRFREALGNTRQAPKDGYKEPEPDCIACGDRGHGWVEHKVIACTCPVGQRRTPEDIARLQFHYDRGRKLFKNPFDKNAPEPSGKRIFPSLPYDPKTSVSGAPF